jgi:anti-sigma factor RsiW
MTSTDRTHPLLAELETVLDVCGGCPERWPDGTRARLSAFVAENREAARMFAEARALDALLDAAPAPIPPRGLEARIMAAAPSPRREPRLTAPARATGRMWLEAALLAASLFIGIVIGASGQVVPALRDVALMSGFLDPDGLPGREAL